MIGGAVWEIQKQINKLHVICVLTQLRWFSDPTLCSFSQVFMILRKKDSHVTFLHLYHHTSMVAFSWLSVKYIQGTNIEILFFYDVQQTIPTVIDSE